MAELRNLIVVLGDQLELDAAAFDGFDAGQDAVWMAEVAEESTHVWSSKPRTALFLAAMRHFALALQAAGRPLHYTRLDAPGNAGSLDAQLQADIERLRPARLVMTTPGDWRVLQALKAVAGAQGLALDVREDRHFFTSIRELAAHAQGRKSLRMEYFYREQRKRHAVLMQGDEPVGGEWNFDADGGVMGSKPYIATGQYIQRMSPHCKGCRNDPAQRSGDSACPFTTLYWDFLMRHEAALSKNPRMALQVKNVARLTEVQKQAVNERAAAIRRGEVGGEVQVEIDVVQHA